MERYTKLLWSACIVYICGHISCVHASSTGQYTIDATRNLGRKFDGIGGLSGGGATSKLLVNYEEPYRSQILDYLFKPEFGAALQILKVEIGGDGQSTDGTESSHMHEPWDENYNRGYEWWLMVEAKKRNPSIKLYGLPWAFPGWVANGTQNPWTMPSVTAMYIVKWVDGASKYYNLTIDYVGVWNERPFNADYIKALRRALDEAGYQNVQLVAADNAWFISGAVLQDPELAKAVSIIGAHYPGTNSSKIAQMTHKPLWSSEDYSTLNDNVGAGCWARILNDNYVNGLMTSTISWNLIASYYEDLPYGRDGLMTAMEPWSGHYTVESPIWVTAHTTHFTSIGWQYLGHNSGVGHLDGGGSYVSLISPDKQHFSIIIETMSHNHSKCIRPGLPTYTVKPQTVTFILHGSLARVNTFYVWHSKINFDGTPSKLFVQRDPIGPSSGKITLQLGEDEMFTLTTIQHASDKPYSKPPPSKPFKLPYGDNFESYMPYSEAFNFAPQVGVWEVRRAMTFNDNGQRKFEGRGQVNRQVVLNEPCYWCNPGSSPINIGGNYNWTNIFVQIDVMIPSVNSTTGVFVAARVDKGGCGADGALGFFLAIYAKSDEYRLYSDYKMTKLVINGTLNTKIQYDTWYHLGLVVSENEAHGFFEVDELFKIHIGTTPWNGFAAYGSTSYGLADFDNLMIMDSTIVKHL